MCAVATVSPYNLLLFLAAFALTVSIFFEGKLTSEALPIIRQERSVDEGPLHGSDFLSVFIDSSSTSTERYRIPRSTIHLTSYQDTTRKIRPTIGNLFKINRNNNKLTSENNIMSDGVVVAVRVSSSIGKTLINKNTQNLEEQNKNDIEDFSLPTTITTQTTTETPSLRKNKNYYVIPLEDGNQSNKNHIIDQISIPSEDHPSILAESNKNDFSIEEKEPITTDSDTSSTYVRLPEFNPPQDLLQNGESQSKLHPYQQTVIFHNQGNDNQARSVSYSTVVQDVSNGEKLKTHERQERHYDNTKNTNINNYNTDKKYNQDQDTSNSYAITERTRNSWETITTTTTSTLTPIKFNERNWESPEKSYTPKHHYAEQNYEVDESVSVVTNGRVHGVQLKQQNDKNNNNNNKKDDNQKVGYVVEGRNYRKYRVEERTPDGFIVGEYGVVSHDDGSLRGVRYTADGTINPRLIYDALMKFLSL